jgi:hypothetical protein
MTAEFLRRIRRDLTITLEGFRETVIAIAEHVTRKVQIMSLHWQAAATLGQMKAVHRDLGRRLVDAVARRSDLLPPTPEERADVERQVIEASRRLQLLRRDMGRTDGMIGDLELEVLREDWLAFQRDLAIRAASIQRVVVPRGSTALDRTVREIGLSPSVRLVAVLRGPTVLVDFEHLRFRAGDTVVLLGRRDDLKEAVPRFTTRRTATA